MLDDLLGKTTLKERIADLEAERDDLESQLEAEQDRRADAQTARQEAERRANRLEDRIAELEDRVERLQSGEAERTVRRTEDLSGPRLQEVLDRLASVETGPEGVLTAFVPDERNLPEAVREVFADRTPLVRGGAPCLAVADDAGLLGVTLSVPVPPSQFATWSDRVELERSWFEPSGQYTLALVRSDLFAMGTFDGRERTAFHGFESDLKNQHSKGGFSQARFERLRDEQLEDHVQRCRAALDEREAETLYLVGEQSVIWELSDLATVTTPVDATGDPEPALDDAFEDFWNVRLRAI